MANDRYNKKEIELKKYIPSDHFRTVESFEMLKAKSETRAEIELKDNFKQQLSFHVPWDGKLYAYIRRTKEFTELCEENSISEAEIKTVYMQDWDEKFLLNVESGNSSKEAGFFVSNSDMIDLLEHCCRIESQKGIEK